MTAQFLDTLFLGLVTYLSHSTVFLAFGLLLTALPFMKNINLKEMVLKTALFAALLTTPLHLSGAFETVMDPISLPKETLQSEPASLSYQVNSAEDNLPASTPVTTAVIQPEPQAAGSQLPTLNNPAEGSGPSLFTLTNIVLMVWALLGTAFLFQLVYLVIGLKIQISGRRTLTSGRALSLAKSLAKEAGIPTPHISTKENLAGPFCLGTGEILIPEWAERLPHSQLKAMIAHEIAHIKRADPYWVLAARIVQSVFFFQPLNVVAARKLSELSEFACDAWAGQVCGSGMPLAECLAECAKRHLGKAPSALGAAMASKRSPIVERTHALLSGLKDYAKPASTASKVAVLSTFVIGAAMIPVFAFEEEDENVFYSDDEAETADAVFFSDEVEPANPSAPTEPVVVPAVEAGEVLVEELAPGAVIAPGEAVVVDEVLPASPTPPVPAEKVAMAETGSHSSYILSDDDGYMEIKISYTDDDVKMKIRGEGKFEPREDETGIQYMSDGSYLDITETRDGTTRRVRYSGRDGKIFESYWLNGKDVSKDDEMARWVAQIIPAVYRQTGMDAEGRTKRFYKKGGVDAVLEEMDYIPGSYTKRVYASTLVDLGQMNDRESKRFMDVIGSISGSYDLRETLTAYSKAQELSETEWGYFVQTAGKISGSYDLRETLSSAAADFKGPRANWRYLLETAGQISSSYDLRETLVSFKKSMPKDDETIEQLAQVARKISSSYDLRETLVAFAEAGGFGEKGWLTLLDTIKEISSGYDKRSTLEEFADEMPKSETFLAKYREVAETIRGQYDREQALKAID